MKKLSHSSPSNNSIQSIQSIQSKTKESGSNEPKLSQDGNGNTRFLPINEINVHLDYLRIRKQGMTSEEFQELMSFISKDHVFEFDTPWSPGKGATFFPHRVITTLGAKGGFEIDEDGLYSFMLDMPGEFLESKTVIEQWRFVVSLYHHYKVKNTRTDIAIDDSSYSLIPFEEMYKACEEGSNFYFNKVGYHSSGKAGQKQSETFNFGSRNSGKFIRVYDHDGECMRFEAELKRGYAHPAFKVLADIERFEDESDEVLAVRVQKELAAMTLGLIDFRDRGNRRDNKRSGVRDSVRLQFWQKFIDAVSGATFRIRLIKPAKTIRKTFDWIKRQTAPSLAMICQGLGKHAFNLFIKETIENGLERMDNQKKLHVKEIRQNKKMYC